MNASARSMLGFLGLSAGILSIAGCPTGGEAVPGGATLPSAPAPTTGRLVDITDGTSNTIHVGELPAEDPMDSGQTGGDGSVRPVGNQAALAAIRARLADRVFHFASSSGNSDNNAFVTGVTDLQLCDIGRFGMREFTSFASSVGDFSSEEFLNGTWTVQESGGGIFVVLTVEESTRQTEDATRALLIQTDGSGTFSFDGSVADSENAAADCAAAARQSATRAP